MNCFALDMNDFMTNIGIFEGANTWMRTIPIGWQTILRVVQRDLNISEEDALENLSNLNNNDVTRSLSKTVNRLIG